MQPRRKCGWPSLGIPDGVYSRTDHLDDGSPICVSIRKTGDRAVVDFTGTGPVLATNLNANRAIVTAAVLYVFRCLINEDIPLNSGVLEPVDDHSAALPAQSRARGRPRPVARPSSAAMWKRRSASSTRLLGALGAAAASQGTMNNLTFGDGSVRLLRNDLRRKRCDA